MSTAPTPCATSTPGTRLSRCRPARSSTSRPATGCASGSGAGLRLVPAREGDAAGTPFHALSAAGRAHEVRIDVVPVLGAGRAVADRVRRRPDQPFRVEGRGALRRDRAVDLQPARLAFGAFL